jgi:hypothetical protein
MKTALALLAAVLLLAAAAYGAGWKWHAPGHSEKSAGWTWDGQSDGWTWDGQQDIVS